MLYIFQLIQWISWGFGLKEYYDKTKRSNSNCDNIAKYSNFHEVIRAHMFEEYTCCNWRWVHMFDENLATLWKCISHTIAWKLKTPHHPIYTSLSHIIPNNLFPQLNPSSIKSSIISFLFSWSPSHLIAMDQEITLEKNLLEYSVDFVKPIKRHRNLPSPAQLQVQFVCHTLYWYINQSPFVSEIVALINSLKDTTEESC